MLFKSIAAVLIGGLELGAAATPLSNGDVTATKRQVPDTHRLHERGLPHWPTAWTKKTKVPSDALLPMRIGLKQANLAQGHDMLMEISNPESPNYGKHLTVDEVTTFFAPAEEIVQAVTDWLTSAGISANRISLSANKQWIQFDAHASEVESLLFTDFYVFEHTNTGSLDLACDEYHVPSHVGEHIDYITPGVRRRIDPNKVQELKKRNSSPESRSSTMGKRALHSNAVLGDAVPNPNIGPILPQLDASQCYKYLTPECLRTQYGFPEGSKAATGNELGVFQHINQHYYKENLDVYFTNVYPKIPNGTYPIDRLIDGAIGAARNESERGLEPEIDFQLSMPLIWPQQTVLFQTDDQFYEKNQSDFTTPFLGFWNTFFDALDGSYCTYSAYGQTGNCETRECMDPIYPNPFDSKEGYQGQLQCGVYKPTNVISISYSTGEGDNPPSYWKRQCDEIMKLGLQGVTVVVSSGDNGVGSYLGDVGLADGCAGPDGKIFYPEMLSTCPYTLSVGGTQADNKTSKITPGVPLYERATERFASGGGFSNVFDTPEWQRDQVKNYLDTVKLNFTGYTSPGTNYSSVGKGVFRLGGRGFPDVSAIGDRYIIRYADTWYSVGGTSVSAPLWASLITLANEERLESGKKTVGYITPLMYKHPEIFTDITEGSNPSCHSTGFLAAPGWDPVTGLGSPKFPKLLEVLTGLP